MRKARLQQQCSRIETATSTFEKAAVRQVNKAWKCPVTTGRRYDLRHFVYRSSDRGRTAKATAMRMPLAFPSGASRGVP